MEQKLLEVLSQLLIEQKKTNEKLDNVYNLFYKYYDEQSFGEEIIRDQGRTDLIS